MPSNAKEKPKRGRATKYDWAEIRRLFVEVNMTPALIAKQYFPSDSVKQIRLLKSISGKAKADGWAEIRGALRAKLASPEVKQEAEELATAVRNALTRELVWLQQKISANRAKLDEAKTITPKDLMEQAKMLLGLSVAFKELGYDIGTEAVPIEQDDTALAAEIRLALDEYKSVLGDKLGVA